jgi:Glucokinase
MPLSGLYVAGGIAPKNIEFIRGASSKFMARLLDKGRMTSILGSIPIHVVMKEDLGLRGAHIVAARMVSAMVGDVETRDSAAADGVPLGKDAAAEAALHEAILREASLRAAGLGYGAVMRLAVADYPLAYAAITSLTAAVTASMIVIGGRLVSQLHRRPGA